MPRIYPAFSRMVFFLYGRDPNTGEVVGPQGTGILVGLPGSVGLRYDRHVYAVTCHHVAPRGASIIRINTNDGKSRWLEFEPHEWQFMKHSDDLAAVDVTDRLHQPEDDFSFLPSSLIATPDFMRDVEFGIGEDGFMLGLFANHPGKERNLIAARFGNVSLLASDDDPIRQGNEVWRPSHLFDMRSRTGFSGSPVFTYRTPAGDLRTAPMRGRDKIIRTAEVQRLKEINPFRVREAEMYAAYEAANNTLHIPNSMTVVVPAWRILSLLEMNVFVREREQRDMEDKVREAQQNDAAPESSHSNGG